MNDTSGCVFESRRWWAALVVGVFGALLLAALARSMMHHTPLYDELLHVLAARGIAQQGAPVIDRGVYDRAELFTRIVAVSTKVCKGNEMIAARLPALLASLALIALVGVWTTRKAGMLAGLLSVAVLAIMLESVEVAVFARFYSLHALAVFIVFVCLYEAVGRQRPGLLAFAGCLVAAVAAFALAWHLQSLTIIAAGAIALGLAAGAAYEWREIAWPLASRYKWLIVLVLILGATAVALVLPHLSIFDTFTQSAGWAEGSAGRVNFYNQALGRDLPMLWPLLPFAILAVALRQLRLALTLGLCFLGAFAVSSLAAQKASRYLYYVEPMLAILLGCGLAIGWLALQKFLAERCPRYGRLASPLAVGLLLLAAMASQEGFRSVRLLLAKDPPSAVLGYGNEADWSSAKSVLMPAVEAGDTVIASNAMKALFYLGRYDIELNKSIVGETDTGEDFGHDERTGRRAIGSAAALDAALRESPSTLVVVEDKKLGVEQGVPADVVERLNAACAPLDVPARAQLKAWKCRRPGD